MFNLQDVFNILNFWINKETGGWYTVSELTDLIDAGQLSYYSDIKPQYATSNLIKEILSPFRSTYDFATIGDGIIEVPNNVGYLDLLDIRITGSKYHSVLMVNEDTMSNALNSQTDPVTSDSPVGEIIAPRRFRLYPASVYNGTVTYLKRPVKPVFAYSVISGRVIVYDNVHSVQLGWRDTEIQSIILKSLKSIGINLNSQEIAGWSQAQTQANFIGANRI